MLLSTKLIFLGGNLIFAPYIIYSNLFHMGAGSICGPDNAQFTQISPYYITSAGPSMLKIFLQLSQLPVYG